MKPATGIVVWLAALSLVACSEHVLDKPQRPAVIPCEAPDVPTGDYKWVPGRWSWQKKGNNYVWRDGHWSGPRRHTKWIDGYWIKAKNGHKYVAGHWQ